MTTMAYDFGNEIHVLELNEFDAHDGTPVTVLGAWRPQGEAEGVEVAPR